MAFHRYARSSCAWHCAPATPPPRSAGSGRACRSANRPTTSLIHPKPYSTSNLLCLDERSRSSVELLVFRMIVTLFLLPRHEVALRGRRRGRTLLHRVLEQHVHEQIHRLGLDHQGARGLLGAGIEVLVHAIVMHDRDIAGLPVVADAVVNLVARPVENVEGRLVDMAVLLGGAAWRIFLEMDVQRLGAAILRLDVVAAEMLRAAVELELLALDDPRHRPQPAELVLEAVGPGELAHENAVLARIVLSFTNFVHPSVSCSALRSRATS